MTESHALKLFHPLVADWFRRTFGAPTDAQEHGWPAIAEGRDTLIAAPTGSGKTFAAFLVCIDRLLREAEAGTPAEGVAVVYVSPLKALSNDIRRNLEAPLEEITAAAQRAGIDADIRAMVRTGDTPAAQRQAMLRNPPRILVTTPESLYLLVTSERGRGILRGVRTVIVDEIHALARDKRGSHLTLTLARLDALCGRRPVRIGLSATQRPIETVASFLVGTERIGVDGVPDCKLVDIGHGRALDLAIEVPPTDLEAVCSGDQWNQVYDRLLELIHGHHSTLIFVNTRRMTERIAHRLTERLGADAIASHHGSLAKELRQSAEARLKAGTLKAIIATGSLEMGIDVGYVDLVCQIGSPRSIATFLQRIGRSGHSLGKTPKGRLFPLTRDELLECMALVRAVRAGELDAIEVPQSPLDILCQQIVAAVSCEEWELESLWRLVRQAWPYRDLKRDDFDAVVRIACEGVSPSARATRHLHHDKQHQRLRPRRSARLAALTAGGAIPETGQFRVVTVDDETYIGQLDEDFAIESSAGDIFSLGTNSWMIVQVREGKVVVRDAQGAPPTIPFWVGEAPGRTKELSRELSRFRQELNDRLPEVPTEADIVVPENLRWLRETCQVDEAAARQALRYAAAQKAAMGLLPTAEKIVFERFFDESGGMQLVIHAPLGARINRAWGLALRKRFCRSFDFELQAAATDDGVLLSLGPQHSFPLESLFRMVHVDNAYHLLEQALLVVPMFGVRWRWNVTRSLAVLRQRGGQRVPFFLQRYRSDDLLASVFPETVGCLENHHGDVVIPDHALVRQTLKDCLQEAMDLEGWLAVLGDIGADAIELLPRETREPSPFSHPLLNTNPYAFLDGAALEERRTRAVTTRHGLSLDDVRDLAKLDPTAIAQVTGEARPSVRDPDELQEHLCDRILLDRLEDESWRPWLEILLDTGRAVRLKRISGREFWSTPERLPWAMAIHPQAEIFPGDRASAAEPLEFGTALIELLRGWMAHDGVVTAEALATRLDLAPELVSAGLEGLEADGTVLRGRFDPESLVDAEPSAVQWCDRRLLSRIHRLTLQGLRRQIQPVAMAEYVRFVLAHQHLVTENPWTGPVALRETIAQLQGGQVAAGLWESHLLPARVPDYQPAWLDQLFAQGDVVWGRLRPPALDGNRGASPLALHRSVPLGLVSREDLPWLLPIDRIASLDHLRSVARRLYEILQRQGALFFRQLVTLSGELPGHVEEGLRELAAWGLVTSDSFMAVRKIVAPREAGGYGTRRRGGGKRLDQTPGRWSIFPGPLPEVPPPIAKENWCRLLLKRWGIVFRELLELEVAAPSWAQLVPVFRTLERRGEVRGGRFVLGVAGEQFGSEESLRALRQIPDRPPDGIYVPLSSADPLAALAQLTTDRPKAPATARGSVLLRDGHCVATRVAGTTTFNRELPNADLADVERLLTRGRRLPGLGSGDAPGGASRPGREVDFRK